MDEVRNGKFLATTNELKKVPAEFKTTEFSQIEMNIKLKPEEKRIFALNVAQKFNVNKTPAEIMAIADNPKLTTFRDIDREISKGYTRKQEPLFQLPSVKGRVDLPDRLTTLMDDFEMNRNNYIYTWQMNRNPFIDYPTLADYVFGANFGQPWFAPLSTNTFDTSKVVLYPNPAKNYISIFGISSDAKIEVFSILGKKVFLLTKIALKGVG